MEERFKEEELERIRAGHNPCHAIILPTCDDMSGPDLIDQRWS